MPTMKSGNFGWGAKSTKSTNKTTKSVAAGYSTMVNSFGQRISSYRTLCAQASGPCKGKRPTPATLNTFSKWIEKGATIQKVSPAQVKKWTKAATTIKSAASAKTALCRRFGKTTIKAVTCDKSGAFLVACSAATKGRAFNFPN